MQDKVVLVRRCACTGVGMGRRCGHARLCMCAQRAKGVATRGLREFARQPEVAARGGSRDGRCACMATHNCILREGRLCRSTTASLGERCLCRLRGVGLSELLGTHAHTAGPPLELFVCLYPATNTLNGRPWTCCAYYHVAQYLSP